MRFVNLVQLLALHAVERAETLHRAAFGIEEVGVGQNFATDDSHDVDASGEGVCDGAEDVSRNRISVGILACDRLAAVAVNRSTPMLRFVRRRIRSVVNDGVEQRRQSDKCRARNSEDGAELTALNRFLDGRNHILIRQRALFKILLQQRVVRLGDKLDQSFARLIQYVAPFGRQVNLFGLALRVKLVGLHVNYINDTAKVFLVSNRQRERNDGAAEGTLRALQARAEVRVLFVERVDDHNAREHELVSERPSLLRLHLNAFDGVNNHERAVCHTQRGTCVRDERGVARRVNQVDLGLFVFEMGERRVERHLAFNSIFVVIGRGRAFVNLAPARRGSGDVQKGTDKLCFARVAVPDDG